MASFIVRLITSPNINRFSKNCYCQNQETICNETHYRCHHTSSVSLHYLVKCQMTHWSRRRHWPVVWSTLIEPGVWPPNNPDLNPVDYAVRDALQQMAYQCWRFTTVNQLKNHCRSVGQSAAAFGWSRHWWVASPALTRRPPAQRTHWKFDVKNCKDVIFRQ